MADEAGFEIKFPRADWKPLAVLTEDRRQAFLVFFDFSVELALGICGHPEEFAAVAPLKGGTVSLAVLVMDEGGRGTQMRIVNGIRQGAGPSLFLAVTVPGVPEIGPLRGLAARVV